jgi:hypothetical protein
MRTRFAELTSATEGKRGRAAIIVGTHFFTQLVAKIVKNINTGNMTIRFFRNHDQAMAWLKEIAVSV